MFNKSNIPVASSPEVLTGLIDSNYMFTIGNRRYAFNINEIKNICLIPPTQKDGEREITEVYGGDDQEGLEMSSKIIREVRTQSSGQIDMIMYDLVKLFIVKLLENGEYIYNFNLDFSTSLAFNTMIKWGLLIEVDTE